MNMKIPIELSPRLLMTANGPQCIRKHWTFILAYYIATSIGIGITFASFLLLVALVRRNPMSIHDGLHLSFIFAAICSPAAFAVQVIVGPIIFTKSVICATCHSPQTLNRNPLFAPRGYRVPRCENCGGDLEPSFFWKLEPSI